MISCHGQAVISCHKLSWARRHQLTWAGVLRDISFSEVYWWRGILILIMQKCGQNILLWVNFGNFSQFGPDLAKFQPSWRNQNSIFPNVSLKVRFFTLKIIFLTKKSSLKFKKVFRFGTFYVAHKIFHTFPQVKGLNNYINFPFSLIIFQKIYFWRLKYTSQTKYIFWGNLQFLGWHLYYKNNDENCLIVLIWGQKIYFLSQNYTSQTIYFCL